MKAMIVSASRYGSTTQGAEWIAERLRMDRVDVELYQAKAAPCPDGAELVVLGSGLYIHGLLPEMDTYIDEHLHALTRRQLALFVLAMQPYPVFVRGQAHGGLSQLQSYFDKLGDALVHADMLAGQMAFDRLTRDDATSVEQFYAMLELSPDEVARRKAPRTAMDKTQYWRFAEEVLKKAGRP